MNNKITSKLNLLLRGRKLTLPFIKFPRIKTPDVPGMETPSHNFRLPPMPQFNLGKRISVLVLSLVLLTGATAGIGIYFIDQSHDNSPHYPQSGVYDLGMAQSLGYTEINAGQANPDTATQTLKLLIAGAKVENIIFSNMDVGGPGITWAVATQNTDGSGAKILCDTLYLNRVTAPKLTYSSSTAFRLSVSSTVASGISFSPTLASVTNYVFGSSRSALNVPESSNSSVDRIIIDTTNSTSTVGNIIFEDIRVHTGGISLEDLNCGTVKIFNSTIGSGSGIDSADAVINSSVKVSNFSQANNTEEDISVQ